MLAHTAYLIKLFIMLNCGLEFKRFLKVSLNIYTVSPLNDK